MSTAHDFGIGTGLGDIPDPPLILPRIEHPLHRIAEVRRRQGISVRSAARRLGTSMDQVRRHEDPHCDMPLTELYEWQRALDVPVSELLADVAPPLSEPVLTRARLLRVMKTVRSIKESSGSVAVERLTTMLEEQLVEVMPELKEVSAWPSVGQRRGPNELGRAADRLLPESFFTDHGG